ncbi:MAG TPA: hypothetical protein VGK96_06065 [Candidatus Sulfotelmatobacter sp.]|jgi:hypothetical protein
MIKHVAWVAVVLSSCLLLAQTETKANAAPSSVELAAITERGRMLEEYDVAAGAATDAMVALKPDASAAPYFIARKTGKAWEVVFGKLNPNRESFLIVYKASQGASQKEFTAKKIDPPAEDHGFYLSAAKAIQAASHDFGTPKRNYNAYILPAQKGQFYVYLLPAQTVEGVYPLGGDVRYTIAADGTILNKRQMHPTILESKDSLNQGQKIAAGYHSHTAGNGPEDSDVFHVLNRKPPLPEYVKTPDKHLYAIQTDGSIQRVQ